MTKVITFGNSKGGTGKTTTTAMLSYLLHKQGKKVLVIDFDPQANCTSFLTQTYDYKIQDNYTSLYEALEHGDLSNGILQLDETFDLLPSDSDLFGFPDLARKQVVDAPEESYFFLDYLLNKIKEKYDYVLIDTPPDMNMFSSNALIASDYAVIVMQTHLYSLTGAITYKDYIETLTNYNPDLRIAGVLPSLAKKKAKIDEFILDSASSIELDMKDLLFTNYVYYRERMHRFTVNGITNKDVHDKNVLSMYGAVLDELYEKVGE